MPARRTGESFIGIIGIGWDSIPKSPFETVKVPRETVKVENETVNETVKTKNETVKVPPQSFEKVWFDLLKKKSENIPHKIGFWYNCGRSG